MDIDPRAFKEYFSSLSDRALLAEKRDELVADAQQIYDQELQRRGLGLYDSAHEDTGSTAESHVVDLDQGEAPDWLEGAVSVAEFTYFPGGDAAGSAVDARAALERGHPRIARNLTRAMILELRRWLHRRRRNPLGRELLRLFEQLKCRLHDSAC